METEGDALVVHLVHGTWPYGILARRKRSARTWFEEGSPVRDALLGEAAAKAEVRVFEWSGRNSFKARAAAAWDLRQHLVKELQARPSSRHLLVAHSHGGTVCAHAVSLLDETQARRVPALVCMATPFAYADPRGREGEKSYFLALGTAVFSLLAIVCVAFGWIPLPALSWGGALATLLVGSAAAFAGTRLFAVFFDVRSGSSAEGLYTGRAVDGGIPMLLLRATRDEAALALGVVQAVNRAAELVYAIWDDFVEFDSASGWIALTVLVLLGVPVSLVPAFVLTVLIDGTVMHLATFMTFLLFFIMAFAYLACERLSAITAGLPGKLLPHYKAQVDVAPPATVCQIKAFSSAGGKVLALRHGIYELRDVQAEVAQLIAAVLRGGPPRFRTSSDDS